MLFIGVHPRHLDTLKGKLMSGRERLPSGAPRKASQKRAHPAAPKPAVFAGPTWSAGDRVRWQHHTGTYLRAALNEDDLAEILIGQRTYRVRRAELRSG